MTTRKPRRTAKQSAPRRSRPKPPVKRETTASSTPAPAPSPRPTLKNPNHLLFADEYLTNGFNATQAYRVGYPYASYETCQANGYKLLRNTQIASYLSDRMERAATQQHMSGEEALARVAAAGRLNIQDFYDSNGELMKPHQWPATAVGCVKAIQDGPYGLKLTLVDPLHAQSIILKVTGKLKDADAGGMDALALALTETLKKNGVAPA